MNVHDPEIIAALEGWLEAARLTLESRFNELVHLIGFPRWHALPAGGFKHYPYSPVYHHSILEEAIFKSSAAWAKVERLAEGHANLKRHCTEFVNLANGSGRAFSLQDLCRSMLPKLELIDEQTITADTDFDVKNKVSKFFQAINDDFDEQLTIWPIQGLATDCVVKLDDLTEFRELTIDEKLHCLNFEIIRPSMQMDVSSEHSRWFGLCRLTRDKKIFGIQTPDFNQITKRFADQDQVLEDFLVAVPLTKDRVAFHAGGFAAAPHFEEGRILKFGTTGRGVGASNDLRFAVFDEGANLNAEELVRLGQVWSFIRQTNTGKFGKRVGNAARRMFYAETRTKQDDALVDIIVAAESLYLSENNELSYRTSLYASLWADGDARQRREVFDTFRGAYKLRSNIVHGSTAAADMVAEAIQQVKPILRAAIRKALVHLSTHKAAPDWDSMVFGDEGSDQKPAN